MVPLLRHLSHPRERRTSFLFRQRLVDPGIQNGFLFLVVGGERLDKLLLDLACAGFSVDEPIVNLVEEGLDLPMLHPHHRGRATVLHARLMFKQGEEDLFFPDNVPLEASLEFGKDMCGLPDIAPFQGLEVSEYSV